MTTWYNVKKDNICHELCLGVTATDGELIQRMNWAEYIDCIRPIINLKLNENKKETYGLIEIMLGNVYRQVVRVMEDRNPEIEEVEAYKKSQNAIMTATYLTELAMSHTTETWTEFEANMKQKLGIV